MSASTSLISCNFSFPLKNTTNLRIPSQTPISKTPLLKTSIPSRFLRPSSFTITISHFHKKRLLQTCQSSINTENSQDPVVDEEVEIEVGGNEGSSPGGEIGDWTTSFLLFLLWAGLMYYVFKLTPNQTPSRDEYFLRKLLNLKGDDGFRMNEVLVSLWYIMGLWPLAYSMLLLPTGRSSKSKIPVWPFLVFSFFGGAYALLPYFVLWRPPPPAIEDTELSRWPLNFLESKLTAGVSLAAGLGLIIYAGLANGEVWNEFIQYFKESKFIHITCIDFTLLSTFAPFWVYNDMTARKCLVRCRCFLFAQEKKTQQQDLKKELTYYLSSEEVELNGTGSDANEGLRRRYKVGPKNGISDKGISQEPLSYLQKNTYPEDDFSHKNLH